MRTYNLGKLQPYDIVFKSTAGSLLDRIIWWVEKRLRKGIRPEIRQERIARRTTHVMLCIGYGDVVEMGWTGFRKVTLRDYTDDQCSLLAGRVTEKYDGMKLASVLFDYIDTQYDYLRLVVLLLQGLFNIGKVDDFSHKAMICSELIVDVFRDCGVDLVPGQESCNATPFDLMQSQSVEVIDL